MRRIGIALAAVATLLALFYVSQMVASESGEVVILTTKDAAGRPVETRLWIAEHDGDVWLRYIDAVFDVSDALPIRLVPR